MVKKRDARNVFRDTWLLNVDPKDKFIARHKEMPEAGPLIRLHESGDPASKLDFLILGDGYTAQERRVPQLHDFARAPRLVTVVIILDTTRATEGLHADWANGQVDGPQLVEIPLHGFNTISYLTFRIQRLTAEGRKTYTQALRSLSLLQSKCAVTTMNSSSSDQAARDSKYASS